MLGFLVVLAACGTLDESTRAGGLPTPTPISTPLASVPTAIPPGAEGNPIQMVLKPVAGSDEEDSGTAAAELTTAIQERTALSIEVVTVSRYAEALAALCESGSGKVSMAWLDGVTYMAALAQSCGSPALQVRRDTRREVETGASGQIIINRSLGSTELSAVEGRTFCRLGSDDFYSWLLPLLVLKTEGIDLLTETEAIVDYEDIPALITAVSEGECDAAGIPEDALSTYEDDLSDDVRAGVRVVMTSIPFPYDILMYPLEVQLGVRLALNDALLEIANNPDTAELVGALLGQDELVRAEPKDFAELIEFMNLTELDFAQLGG